MKGGGKREYGERKGGQIEEESIRGNCGFKERGMLESGAEGKIKNNEMEGDKEVEKKIGEKQLKKK